MHFKDPNIISDIKTRRLEYLSHLVRIEYSRIPKNGSNYYLNIKRQLVDLDYDGLIPSKLVQEHMN